MLQNFFVYFLKNVRGRPNLADFLLWTPPIPGKRGSPPSSGRHQGRQVSRRGEGHKIRQSKLSVTHLKGQF